MNNKPWRLLTRLEGMQRVWIYEQLWVSELYEMKKFGWRVVK